MNQFLTVDYWIGVSQNMVAAFIVWAPAFTWHHRRVMREIRKGGEG